MSLNQDLFPARTPLRSLLRRGLVAHLGTLVCVVALSGAACARDQPALAPRKTANASLASSLVADPRPKAIRFEEQPFADLAHSVPSSAGYFVDRAGNLVVYVRDTTDFGAARLAAAPIIPAIKARSPRTRLDGVLVRKAQYSFWQLATWRDAIFEQMIGRSSIISLDLEEQTNRVAVGVRAENMFAERDSLMRWMSRLKIDTAAVRIYADTPVKFATAANSRVKTRRRYGSSLTSDVDTIVGGIMFFRKKYSDTTKTSWCTIGTVIDYGGARSFLTASHCTWTMFAIDSTYAYRASGTGARIGIETNDTNGFGCNWIYTCRGTDVAIYGLYSPFNSAQSRVGLVARPTSYSEVVPVFCTA